MEIKGEGQGWARKGKGGMGEGQWKEARKERE